MQKTTMDPLWGDGAKRHAPATLRNRDAIAGVLADELPESGTVLEVASGSGEHAVYFAERFPQLDWQPSDPDPDALTSITAYHADFEGSNLRVPITLDASAPETWSLDQAEATLCINMIHISPWAATVGLFKGARQILSENAPLILYGPYFEPDVEPAPSNLDFDMSLRQRNSDWGVRNTEDVTKVANHHGFSLRQRKVMPANNLMLTYRRD